MTVLVYAVVAICALVFACATIVRTVWYARQPIHMRWEIHPVPHGRRAELAVMVPEVLFLNGLREFNRTLWLRSFPFHFGLYLTATAGAGLLLVAGAARFVGHSWLVGPVAAAIRALVGGAGTLGLVLAILGAVALLHRRLTDPVLRLYTTPGDIFNLVFFVAALATLGAGYAARPAGSPGALAIVTGLLSWDASVSVSPLLAAGLVLTATLVAYIPLTHMSHFVGKYFTYHRVRWDDAPADARMSASLAEYLTYRPTWAAEHINAKDGATWAEIVTTNPTRGSKP